MKQTIPKPQHCAIYTRKSTEHNLDLAFNSLDAQRGACEAYVKSQAHEGWRLIRDKHEGEIHEVIVAPGGLYWAGRTYSSLSAIARKITGTSWNGPRFFGLRGNDEAAQADQEVKSTGLGTVERRPSRGAVRPRVKGAAAGGAVGDRG
jgi:hypothetical protein